MTGRLENPLQGLLMHVLLWFDPRNAQDGRVRASNFTEMSKVSFGR